MTSSDQDVKNSSLVSIRKPCSQNVLSDTNEDEKVQTPNLTIDALRIIGRLVRSIRAKIESESRNFK